MQLLFVLLFFARNTNYSWWDFFLFPSKSVNNNNSSEWINHSLFDKRFFSCIQSISYPRSLVYHSIFISKYSNLFCIYWCIVLHPLSSHARACSFDCFQVLYSILKIHYEWRKQYYFQPGHLQAESYFRFRKNK